MQNKGIRPFLKWAGGKYALVHKIQALLPQGTRLIEPFVGAGSVFLNTQYPAYCLADINADLIRCYQYLQKEKGQFIEDCRVFFQKQYNEKSAFLSLRNDFNTTEDPRLKAILLVYLNRHCFNGLMRYNGSGLFNTSFGTYKAPYFPMEEMTQFVKKAQATDFICADYRTLMRSAKKGDLVYCDPPYMPLSATARFTGYYRQGFYKEDQEHLAALAQELAKKGIPVLISNHDTPFIRDLYKAAEIHSFPVRRTISSAVRTRWPVQELLALFS